MRRKVLKGLLIGIMIWLIISPVGLGQNQPKEKPPQTPPSIDFQFDLHQLLGLSCTGNILLGDIDGDDDLDLIEGNYDGTNRIYINDSSGNFVDSGQAIGSSRTGSIALGDIDNDGDLDLIEGVYWRWIAMYLNDGAGTFTDSGQILPSRSTSMTLGDIDNDGDLDLVTNSMDMSKARLNIYLNPFLGFLGPDRTIDIEGASSIALGDIDGDRDLDIVVGHYLAPGAKFKDPGPPDKIYLNNGSGVFADSGQNIGSYHTSCLVLGDLDADADLDLVVGIDEEVGLKIYLNNGLGKFLDTNRALKSGRISQLVLKDIDNDGDLDLIVANNGIHDKDAFYLNDGTAQFIGPFGIGETGWDQRTLSIDIGDIDNDGDLDLVVGKGDPNSLGKEEAIPNKIYLNTLVDTLKSQPKGKYLTTLGYLKTMVFQNFPNPFNPETWIPYQLANDALVTIRIYNANGQLVRKLNLGKQNAGIYATKEKAAYWNGRDSLGEKVSSGVYFYTLQAENFSATRKMIILK